MTHPTSSALNANSPLNVVEVAKRLANVVTDASKCDDARAPTVDQMLAGKHVSFDAFYPSSISAPAIPEIGDRELLRAQLVRLLAEIGMGKYARYIDAPEQPFGTLQGMAHRALAEAHAEIEQRLLATNRAPALLELLANEYSPELVFRVLTSHVPDLGGSYRESRPAHIADLQSFAKANDLQPLYEEWSRKEHKRGQELARKLLESAPTPEHLQEARALGVTMAELRGIARRTYLTAVEWGKEAEQAKIVSTFATIGFNPANAVSERDRQAASEQRQKRHSKSALDGLRSFLENGVRSEADVDKIRGFLIETEKACRASREEGAQLAIELYLNAEVQNWRKNDGAHEISVLLAKVVIRHTGVDGVLAADSKLYRLREQEFQKLLERAIDDPWNATFGPNGSQRWIGAFEFNPTSGEPISPEIRARANNAVLRFWNRMMHDPNFPDAAREGWLVHLETIYPALKPLVAVEKRHYLRGTDLEGLFSTSPFASAPGFKAFTKALLDHQNVDVDGSELDRMLMTQPESLHGWLGAYNLPLERIAPFAAEALRLVGLRDR